MKKKYLNINTLLLIVTFIISSNLFAQNATVTISEDSRIPILLEQKKDLEKRNKLTVGYTIQLYYGEHAKANDVAKKYRSRIGTWPVSIEYETPNYKVWVGNFSSKLKADQALLKINKKFPAAFILKPDRG